MKRLVERASVPAPLVAQLFNPCTRAGKITGATKNFSGQFLMGLRLTHKA
jgi:hypothetical protein